MGFRSTGRPAPREACRACGEQPQAPQHSPGDTGVACEPSSGVVPWALPLRASVNQDSAPILTGPRPPRALPRPGPPCASPHIVPNIPAEPWDVGCGHLWEDCHEAFLPIWPIRNPTHRELERQVGGRPAGQRQSELKARELGELGNSSVCPARPARLPRAAQAWGPPLFCLFSSLSRQGRVGTGPLAIKAPRDRKAQLKRCPRKYKKENKTAASPGTSPAEAKEAPEGRAASRVLRR